MRLQARLLAAVADKHQEKSRAHCMQAAGSQQTEKYFTPK
jgi:hypothetical protein